MKKLKLSGLVLLILSVIIFSCADNEDTEPEENLKQVQNSVPTIKAQSFNVSEAATDTDILATVVASDVDSLDVLSFGIKTNDNDLFEISTDGKLSLADGKSLDAGVSASHKITVEVTDDKDTASAIITLQVISVSKNTAPKVSDQSFDIAENNSIDALIGQIVASDAEGDELTFSWPGKPLHHDLDVASDGKLIASTSFNHEIKDSYSIDLEVSDGTLTSMATITVNITDVNEAPTFDGVFTFFIDEDVASGTTVGQVTATDPEGTSLTYKFLPSGAGVILFQVSSDGTIKVHQSKTLDYETDKTHSVRVEVTDGEFKEFIDVTINVNDIFEPSGITVSAFIGGGFGTPLNGPRAMVKDAAGVVYISDWSDHVIRKMDTDGNISVFAGMVGQPGNSGGTGTSARFRSPNGMTIDAAGNLYVCDQGNHAIRKITPTGEVSVYAGSLTGTSGYVEGALTVARFNQPTDIVMDGSGNFYVTDQGNHSIRAITSAGRVATIGGSGDGMPGSADGDFSSSFNKPTAVAIDGSGNLFIADLGNNRIRKIDASGLTSTLAGSTRGLENGVGSNAKFNSPSGIAVDHAGNIFVAEHGNSLIRKVTQTGEVSIYAGEVNTVEGALRSSLGWVNGDGLIAKFKNPRNLYIDNTGDLFVTDTGNKAIRKVTNDNLSSL
ncbi:NHL domain-containing protein [Reichenbachiella versicolor]|uniref:NHL domain-containing protein n=1 Tax=Reichenbachiella versicolor TaxID=1821036 RepID=UPI000D6E0CE7|nr:cadherin domain-containing protein [Reichenbachiella versicolor]